MRADLSTIQQTLTPEAAAALGRAMEEASRRRHGQTTPLHVAAALLAAPTGLLRAACARSGAAAAAGAGGHPLQCRALELCFSVALDRLPAAAAQGAGAGAGAAPPVSNALVAALKRAQAQQRRGCPEAAQQPLLAVKVELEQLVLSILDDPSVSRVMREASFSSADVKAIIEQTLSSSPSTATTASSACSPSPSPSPLPLAAARSNTYLNPRLALAAAAGDDAKKVLDIFLRQSRRNPVLVGDTGPDAVLKDALRKISASASPALAGAKILPLGAEFAALAGDKAAIAARIRELGGMIDALILERSSGSGGGVILDLGDLKWLVEGPAAAASEGEKVAVAEMGRLLKRFGKEVWVVGTAACATYLRCQVYHPGMEAEWDLQAVPIARRVPLPGAFPRLGANGILSSSVETLSPMRGLTAAAPMPLRWPPGSTEPPTAKPAMCQVCKVGYQHEIAKLVAERMDKPASRPEAAGHGLPHWLQLGTDQSQHKEQELKVKKSTEELEKKWCETCSRLHPPRAEKPLAPALSMPLAAFSSRPLVEPKLALARAAAPTLRMNTNWEKPAVTSSPELRKSPPGSPVKTDLVLGRLELPSDASAEKVPKGSLKEGLTDLQKAKIAGISDIDSFKRLLKGLAEKVSWQSDAASAIAAVVIQCRSGSGKSRSLGPKGDMWLLFVGPDQVGKRKMATTLSELMANTGPVIVNFSSDSRHNGGNGELNMGFWGKTSLDRVSEAVRQNPFSVIVLEGIDQADAVVRGKIKRAMQTGRLPDSRGREVSLGNVIFILTANWVPEELSGSTNESLLQCEEKIMDLANSGWQLELSVGDKPVKHRADWLCDDGRPAKLPKELSSGLGLSLDLNLAVGGSDDTEGSRNSSDVTVEHEQEKGQLAVKCLMSSPVYELLDLVDDAIVFRPVDFGPLRKTVLDCISAKFESVIGKQCSFRIDEDAIDRMVGSIWLTDEKFEDWAEKVLAPSIERLRCNSKHDRAVIRLAAVTGKALQRRGGTVEGLPTTVTIAVDSM